MTVEERQIDRERWMRLALQEAQKAFTKEEVPVGAVVVYEGEVIGSGHNLVETLQDAAAHAEMLAINAASNRLASWRLDGAELYVTLEPCMMCTGAALLSRVSRIIYGASDPRYGSCGTRLDLALNNGLDVHVEVIGGVLAAECGTLLQCFFAELRQRKR